MSLKDSCLSLLKKYGGAAKLVTSTVLNVVAPGSGVLVKLVEQAFDKGKEMAQDHWEAKLLEATQANADELQHLGRLFDLLNGDLAKLCDKAAAFANQPNMEDIIRQALASDRTLNDGLRKLDVLVADFACIKEQQRRLLDGQERQGQTLQAVYEGILQLLDVDKSRQRRSPTATEDFLRLGLKVRQGEYDSLLRADNPSCLLVLVDQSKSMRGPFGRQPQWRKADGVAVSINWILDNVCKEMGTNEDRLFVGVFGYGGSTAETPVCPIFEGALATLLQQRASRGEPELVSTKELHANKLQELRVVKKKGQPARKVPIWLTARATGTCTPMKEAFQYAQHVLQNFLKRHPKCFPPIVLNFTDGRPNTGNPERAAKALRGLGSANGKILLFNAHLSDRDSQPIVFPPDLSAVPPDDTFARQMFAMSSTLPDVLILNALGKHISIEPGGHCFAFNGDLDSVVKMLQVGTTSFTGSADVLRMALLAEAPE